jgi:predicted AlkP superfamily phosphohydrolase/phosphomutase
MPPAVTRTIVVGLELGDGKLLHAWAQGGKLPFLKSLIDRGCWGWLETTAEQLHISAWPTIYTGTAPGEHGVYFTFQPAPGLQGYQRFHSGLYGKPTFWKLLDQAGLRCCVIDAPYTHPEQGFSGIFIYDWGTWAHYLQPGSVPETVLRQMQNAVGAYPLGLEANDLGFEALDSTDIARRLGAAIQAKTDATCWLIKQHPADALLTVFGETHVAGHYCWPANALSVAAALDDAAMLSVYQALDRAIARICEAAGDDGTVIVVSGDRVGPNHAGWHLLPDILVRLNYLARATAQTQGGEVNQARPRFDPVKALRDLLPVGLRKALARRLPTSLRDKLAQRVDTADIDWSRTRAYWLPTDLEGYIRINLAGREPQGIVQPGADYEAALADLSAALLELRDPASDRPVVSEVIRTDQRFPGARRGYLPDLIVRWNGAAPITAAHSERVGTIAQASPDARPGTHRGPGFVLASGAGIIPGTLLNEAHILDFAPTMLKRLGAPVPDYMPGRAWPELTRGS